MGQEYSLIERTLAKMLFEIYNNDAGGKTWDGRDIPLFGDTGEAVQQHWFAVARFVLTDKWVSLVIRDAAE